MMPRILAFAGSTRKDSFNKKVLAIAARGGHDAVARTHEAFQPGGSVLDPRQQAGIEGLGKTLAAFLAKVKV